MPEITVSIEGVQKLLQKLNPQKACGPDQIPARILRDLADVIAPPLTLIFQKSLDEGNIPNDWRTANVTAIFKKGERYKASNYRPVSLVWNLGYRSDQISSGVFHVVLDQKLLKNRGYTSKINYKRSGVHQGTVLGPLLFLIFINDLPNCVQSRIRLFADDCILYRNIRSNEDTIVLQDDRRCFRILVADLQVSS
jgi:hypothetical protein